MSFIDKSLTYIPYSLSKHAYILAYLRSCFMILCFRVHPHPVPSHEATLGELERVREELMEERARRHLERGLEEELHVQSMSDVVTDALQYSEESVIEYLRVNHSFLG